MSYLNPELAAMLQYITFPLEFIGIALATIEVRFHSLTASINAYLKTMYVKIQESDRQHHERHPVLNWIDKKVGIKSLPAPAWAQTVLWGMITWAVLGSVFLTFSKLTRDYDFIAWNIHEANRLMFLDFLYFIYLPIIGVVTVLLICLAIAVRFVEDRAVGTLGIIIAGLGLTGEAYQLVVQLAY